MSLSHTFSSVRDYANFIAAQGFHYTDNPNKEFPISKVEAFTKKVLAPVLKPLDNICRNVNKPMFIAAVNVAGVAGATLFFYPDTTFETVRVICSPFFDLEPWMPKFGVYVFVETMITGLMVRTLARLNNIPLLEAWKNREVVPIHLGSTKM